jgi:phosphate uptake regulator
MKRKLVKQGGKALTITLPMKWCRKSNLKPGDEVEVEEQSDRVIVYAGERTSTSKKETSIHLETDNKRFVRSILGALYRSGYDTLTLTYDDEKIFRSVEAAVNNLIGFEIFDKRRGICTIKSLAIEPEGELNSTLNRIISTTKTLQSIFREDYINNRYDRYEEVEDFRLSCWRLRDYCMRILIKNHTLDENSYALLVIIWTLEKINKTYKKIYETAKENRMEKNSEVLDYFDEITKYYSDFTETIHKSQLEKIENLNTEYYRLVEIGMQLVRKSGKNNLIIVQLIEIVRMLQSVSSFLVTAKFDQ